MDFPERFKQLRKDRGLTQVEIAKALGVSNGTIAMWETGRRKPQFETLNRMSAFFNCSLDYVLGTSDNLQPVTSVFEERNQFGGWIIEEECEDMLRKFILLDDCGKDTVKTVLKKEFNRSMEQGTLNSSKSVYVSVRSKQRP